MNVEVFERVSHIGFTLAAGACPILFKSFAPLKRLYFSLCVVSFALLTMAPSWANSSEVVQLIQSASKKQIEGNFPEAETLSKQALKEALALKASGLEALCRIQMGRMYGCENKYEEAFTTIQAGIALLESQTELPPAIQKNLLADGLSALADCCMRKGDYESAKAKLKKSIDLVGPPETVQDASVVVGAMNTLALIYGKEDKYSLVIETIQKALPILPKLGSSGQDFFEMKCKLLENLSNAYANTGQSAKAIGAAKEALEICKSHQPGLRIEISTCSRTLGTAYLSNKEFDLARSWIQKAFDEDKQSLGPDNPFLATDLDTLGLISMFQGRYSQAKSEFEKALIIVSKAKTVDSHMLEHLKRRLDQVKLCLNQK